MFNETETAAPYCPFVDGEILTVEDVRQRLRFGTTKPVRAAISRGELVAHQPGREFRILGSDANAWWTQTRVQPAVAAKQVQPPRPRSRPMNRRMPILT